MKKIKTKRHNVKTAMETPANECKKNISNQSHVACINVVTLVVFSIIR